MAQVVDDPADLVGRPGRHVGDRREHPERDDDLRLRLEAGALEQARRFSWERTAESTLEVYDRARVELTETVR